MSESRSTNDQFHPEIPERSFSLRELTSYDGDDRPAYIAYKGIVYDITNCPKWRKFLHENQHFPGLDLTKELSNAPHNEEVFNRPCVRPVGRLKK
jgi:predicted heme/steroid binding protein